MAERRMFAKTIVDSDAFLEMPASARLLYYDLAMRADDDGFVNSPIKIMKMVGATRDDMNILIMRKFIIDFDNGIVVIKHWRIHNYIQNDRYKETTYKEEKKQLILDENKAYKKLENCECIHNGYNMYTQVRLGKDSIGKNSINNNSSNNKEDIYAFIEQNFARILSPIEIEKVNLWLETFSPDIVRYAIELSIYNNKKNFSYINGIIKNWKAAGYQTLEEIHKNEISNKESKMSDEQKKILDELVDYDWLEDNQ